jgi:DNA-nicking Smr family endonuclease
MSDDILSDEDKALFRNSMYMVTPLKRKVSTHSFSSLQNAGIKDVTKPLQKNNIHHVTHHRPVKTVKHLLTRSITPNYHLSDHAPDTISSDAIISYCKQTIPHKRFKQLKQGDITWQARLDLHGLTSLAARDALSHFIEKQNLTENRCLLIIHGKGGLKGEAPVLKNLVNSWLRQFPQVFAFHSAHAKHGGNGALYVLLHKPSVHKS